MMTWNFDLDNYDGDGIECTDGSKNYLVFFEAKCTGVAEGQWDDNGFRDGRIFVIEDAYCYDYKLLNCEAVLDDEEAEDKIGENPDYLFVDYEKKITPNNCDSKTKEMWEKLKTKDGLGIVEAIKALADDYANETVEDASLDDDGYDPRDDYEYDRYRDDRW